MQIVHGINGTLTIPNTITSIENSAFSGCSKLTGNLTVPNSVINIGDGAFQDCSNLGGIAYLPSTIISIGNSAFSNCKKMVQIQIQAVNPPTISTATFGTMTALTGIFVPLNSVTIYKTAPVWSTYGNLIKSLPLS